MGANVVHLEIPADDTARAREFWGQLFGLEFQAYEGPVEYHMFQNEDEQSGGAIFPRGDDDGLRVYFNTENLDATLEQVRDLGGQVDGEKSPVPGMGWYAHVRDPDGNAFAFWQSDENAPAPAGMESGQASA